MWHYPHLFALLLKINACMVQMQKFCWVLIAEFAAKLSNMQRCKESQLLQMSEKKYMACVSCAVWTNMSVNEAQEKVLFDPPGIARSLASSKIFSSVFTSTVSRRVSHKSVLEERASHVTRSPRSEGPRYLLAAEFRNSAFLLYLACISIRCSSKPSWPIDLSIAPMTTCKVKHSFGLSAIYILFTVNVLKFCAWVHRNVLSTVIQAKQASLS